MEQRQLYLQVRVNASERALLTAAAARTGLSLSAWVRLLLLRAARDDTKEVASA